MHARPAGAASLLLTLAFVLPPGRTAAAGELARLEPPCGYDVFVIPNPVEPSGFTVYLSPQEINNVGEVAGRASHGLAWVPFTWTAEGGVVPLPRPPGVSEGSVEGLNDNGWLLIKSYINGEGDRGFIVPIEGRPTADWIKIEPSGDAGWSYVVGINNLNEVVGHRTVPWAAPGQHLPYVGFTWSPEIGEAVDVALDMAGLPSSGLRAINDAGDILGWSSESGYWQLTTITHQLVGEEVFSLDSDAPIGGLIPTALDPTGTAVAVEYLKIGPSWYLTDHLQNSYLVHDGEILCQLPAYPEYPWAQAVAINASGIVTGKCMVPLSPYTMSDLGTVWFDGVVYSANELAGIEDGSPLNITAVVDVNDQGQLLCYVPAGGKTIVMTPNGTFGDLDSDGAVGSSDLGLLLGAWGREGTRADLDGSGMVDGSDLGLLLASWG